MRAFPPFKIPPVTGQRIVAGAASTTSTAVPSGYNAVRIVNLSGTGVHIDIGIAPVASTSTLYCPTPQEHYFRINAGESVALIRPGGLDFTILVTWMII